MTTLEKLASKHKTWIRVVKSFGCNGSLCEDIVQEAYIKIHTLLNRGLDINYDEDINYFYMYKCLKSLFLDLCRKEAKIQKVNVDYLEKFVQPEQETQHKDITGKMRELNTLLDKMFWYDKKVFDLISSGMSIKELSRKTGISYYSLYNTYKNTKMLIRKNIEW